MQEILRENLHLQPTQVRGGHFICSQVLTRCRRGGVPLICSNICSNRLTEVTSTPTSVKPGAGDRGRVGSSWQMDFLIGGEHAALRRPRGSAQGNGGRHRRTGAVLVARAAVEGVRRGRALGGDRSVVAVEWGACGARLG